jgi:adenine-specific DNA-methyltransferase
MEEVAPFQPARYKRTATLTKGEIRERNADLDPQIVWRGMRITLTEAQRKQLQETGEVELGDARLAWRGKDTQDWSDLVVNPPPMYIQEKVQPKAIIEGIRKEARARAEATADVPDLFSDFNGLDDPEARLEFYQHDQHWSNRMILGDSLQVMASLAEREGMRGKVQCIYIDPPYGIRFNSNWQVSTQDRNVEDGRRKDLTREPEQVKAFRDTWKDGIQSYLTYLRDRLTVARELLADGGSIFVQIGDQNVHRVRAVMDEVFREDNFVSSITFKKTTGSTSTGISNVADEMLWFAKEIKSFVPYTLYIPQAAGEEEAKEYRRVELPSRNIEPVNKFRVDGKIQLPEGGRLLTTGDITSKGGDDRDVEVTHQGKTIVLLCKPNRHWKAGGVEGMKRL